MKQGMVKFWLLAAVLAFVLTPFYQSPTQIRQIVDAEIAGTTQALGKTWGGKIIDLADELFLSAPVQATNLIFAMSKHDFEGAKTNIQQRINESFSFQLVFTYLNTLAAGWMAMLYIMCIRLMICLSWFALLWPMLLAACWDGVSQRKIKFYSFRSIRPGTHTLLATIVVPFTMLPVLYLVTPFSITPTVVPIVVSLMLIPISLLLANSQPIFGEK